VRPKAPLHDSARAVGWLWPAALAVCVSAALAFPAGRDVAATPPLPGDGAQSTTRDRVRSFTIVATRSAFTPDRIEVREGEVVKVTLEAADIPHSFTIDHPYRISKRATPDRPVVFEFRADQPGTFVFYCNLTLDGRCRDKRGTLVVTARPRRPQE